VESKPAPLKPTLQNRSGQPGVGPASLANKRPRWPCISQNDTISAVSGKVTNAEYRALAELRFRIRRFVQEGDVMVRAAGLEPQQYLLLLAIRELPEGHVHSIRTLAERLSLQHHSTVELVDRMESHGYVKRARSTKDRRQVLVSLEPLGEKLLALVAGKRIIELRANGRALVDAISVLLDRGKRGSPGPASRKRSAKSPATIRQTKRKARD
jgi:DNA-binding MarR family transcriptional regulator